jgi:hypothetical protein
MLRDLQQELGAGPLVANHAYGPPHDPMGPGAVSFSMIEGFGASYGYNLSINELLMNAKMGRGTLAHGDGGENDLAAFLIGAHWRAYYGLGGWCDNGTDFRSHWLPQFEQPLGAPRAEATYNASAGVWARQFEHVNVTFDVIANRGRVSGWTFTQQPPMPSVPRGCA